MMRLVSEWVVGEKGNCMTVLQNLCMNFCFFQRNYALTSQDVHRGCHDVFEGAFSTGFRLVYGQSNMHSTYRDAASSKN